jgi:ferrous iron transport protein A
MIDSPNVCASPAAAIPTEAAPRPLGAARLGQTGVIAEVSGRLALSESLESDELERRLLELGFVEGARVQLIHEGLFGRDPIAIRVDDMRVALRRREANAVLVRFTDSQTGGARP